jgi:hypothetical protein
MLSILIIKLDTAGHCMTWHFGITAAVCTEQFGITGQKNEKAAE